VRLFFVPPRSAVRCACIGVALFITLMIEAGCSGVSNFSKASQQPQTPQSVADVVLSTRPVILFNGTGTIANDVSAVAAILNDLGLAYATANSAQLNAMTQAQLNSYKLLIVPGGNSITIGKYLTKTATTNIHNAVINGGLHYLGICAGGFFGGYSIYNGLNLTSGHWFSFYEDYYHGIHKESLNISYPSGGKLDVYWQDGPQLTGWGSIVARFPDGAPAVVEGKSGAGWVILTGVHAEAPASWRYGMTFSSSVASNTAYAKTLVSAALHGTWLPHY
jgi:Biotin-protein ligase, N terminal